MRNHSGGQTKIIWSTHRLRRLIDHACLNGHIPNKIYFPVYFIFTFPDLSRLHYTFCVSLSKKYDALLLADSSDMSKNYF